MLAVRGRPSFKLGVGIVLEDVIPKVDPAKLAVVMVPVRLVRRPGPPLKGRSLEVTRLVRNPWIVLASHAAKSVIHTARRVPPFAGYVRNQRNRRPKAPIAPPSESSAAIAGTHITVMNIAPSPAPGSSWPFEG